jgi:uncharacterized membrane protein
VAIGPVQLIVLGFPHRDFHGEIVSQLERLRDSDTVRVIGALAVHRDAEGEIEVQHLSNLTEDEAIELSGTVGALIDPGIESADDAQARAEAGAQGRDIDTDEEAWHVLDDIANGSSAALLVIEHRWAVPLRDAIARAGGFRISDGFISALDLIESGLVSPEGAEALLDAIKGATAPTSQNLRPGGDVGRQAPGMSVSRQSEIASEDGSHRGSPPRTASAISGRRTDAR